jgi:hypothetical protein
MYKATFRLRSLIAVSTIAVGAIIALSAFGVVRAERARPNGSCSSSGYCLVWQNTGAGGGIEGQGTSGNGVEGTTSSTTGNSAVAGIASNLSGSAHGVYGRSSNGQGVYGKSTSANGVEGHTSSPMDFAGVAGYGDGDSGLAETGVYGDGGAMGVTGESSNGGVALVAFSDDTSTDIFAGSDSANNDYCIIDPKANLKCTGKITGKKSLRVQHRNSGGQQVLAYASESASPTIEDVGTARMFGGVANVPIDSAFASVMNRNSQYYVFLTPLADTRGLYVSAKTPSGFQVREIEGGRSRLDFDYRIVAHPVDVANERLPLAPAIRRLPARPPR